MEVETLVEGGLLQEVLSPMHEQQLLELFLALDWLDKMCSASLHCWLEYGVLRPPSEPGSLLLRGCGHLQAL